MLILFAIGSISLLIIYCFIIKMCVGIDDLCKTKFNEKKMYKYKFWMSFILVFRSCEDTSDDPYKRRHKILDKTNMEHISKLSFWLQIINLLTAICLIMIYGVYRNILEVTEYVQLLKTVFWSYTVYAGCFFVVGLIPTIVIEVRGRKRFKAKEKRQEEALMQQLWHKDASTSSTKEVSQDQITQTSLADSDTTTPL